MEFIIDLVFFLYFVIAGAALYMILVQFFLEAWKAREGILTVLALMLLILSTAIVLTALGNF